MSYRKLNAQHHNPKRKAVHYDTTLFNHAHAPRFPLELCFNFQNNADFFLCKKYTLNGNLVEVVIIVTVKDFRYASRKNDYPSALET